MAREFDLLGDAIPDGRGKAGATGHVATKINVNKVRLLVMSGWALAQIAEELGITTPTLRKHYFQNRSIKTARKHSINEVKGRVLLQLQEAADGGNVSAIKEIGKIADKHHLTMVSEEFFTGKPKQQKLGKKAQRKVNAQKPDSAWGFLPNMKSATH